jgi:hypothetical protein
LAAICRRNQSEIESSNQLAVPHRIRIDWIKVKNPEHLAMAHAELIVLAKRRQARGRRILRRAGAELTAAMAACGSCSAPLPIASTPMPATAGGEAMANEEQIKRLLRQDVLEWNEWRTAKPEELLDLSKADLLGASLRSADLHGPT